MGTKAEGLNRFRESSKDITPKDIDALKEYIDSIEKLKIILDDIKPIYAELLDLQNLNAGPDELRNAAEKLLIQINTYQVPQDITLPDTITSKINKLPSASALLKKMQEDITTTHSQTLTMDVYQNPFRLSIWMEKLSEHLQTAKTFLFHINKSRNI
ncbi:MAG: hypothetical protein AAB729_01655 [Patescibacteria group bacterium]